MKSLATTCGHDTTERIIAAYALHAGHLDDERDIAAVAGVDPVEVARHLADPRLLAKLEAAAIKAEADGETLAPYARHIRRKLLRAVDATVNQGVDGFEAVELDKLLERVLVQENRLKLAQKDNAENLATVHFHIGPHGMTVASITPPAPALIDVVDASVKGLA